MRTAKTRTGLSIAPADRIAVSKDHLYLTVDALHWEQRKRATAQEKKLYNVDESYGGNDNGDFFEGVRNVVWACKNEDCTNPLDPSGKNKFLKYAESNVCPHCKCKDIYDWELEEFGYTGELLAKNRDGIYKFKTWTNEPVNLNHDPERRVGQILDVWPQPDKSSVVELIQIDRNGPHNNEMICRKIESKLVDSGSMELYTSRGLCSVCLNPHTGEEEFCDHLKHNKGGIDQRTGMRVFEICKLIQGCGHAIIAEGDPADPKALFRHVLAEKKNLNSSMASGKFDGKPVFEKGNVVVDKSRIRRAEAGPNSGPGIVPNEPRMDNLKEQLQAFGNFDSTRSPEEIRLAKMTPKERADWEAFETFRSGKRQVPIAQVLDKEFVAASLKQFKVNGGVPSSMVLKVVRYAVKNRAAIQRYVVSHFGKKTQALKRFAEKRLGGHLDEKTLLAYALQHYLEQALEIATQIGGPVSPDDVSTSFCDKCSDLSLMKDDELTSYLEEEDLALDEDDESIAELEMEVAGVPLDEVDPENSEDEEPEPTVMHKAQSIDTSKPEDLKKATGGTDPERSLKPETFPAKPGSLVVALRQRRENIALRMAQGDGELEPLLTEYAKVTAQLDKLKTEKFPVGEDLGGNGISENSSAPTLPKAKVTDPKPEEFPDAEDLGGNGISENPKAPTLAASSYASEIAQLKEMGILPKDAKLAAVEFKEGDRVRVKQRMKPDGGKYGKVLDVNSDGSVKVKLDDGEYETFSKTEVSLARTAQKTDTEEFPESEEGVTVPNGEKATKAEPEEFPESTQVKAQLGANDQEQKKMQNQGEPTPISKDGTITPSDGSPTKPGASLKAFDDATIGTPTPVGKAKSPDEQLGGVDGPEVTSPNSVAEEKMKAANNIDDPSEIGTEIQDRMMTAEFTLNSKPGERSSSYWTVKDDAGLPVLRIAAKTAFPDQVVKHFAAFSDDSYGETLVNAIAEHGPVVVNKEHFEGGATVFTQAQRAAIRKAQAAPAPVATQAQQPANVAPDVADRIMNDAKPGISVVDLIASMMAPVVAESDTLSTTTLIEEIVNLASNQEAVTELTTKLNDKVEEIKSDAGMPGGDAEGQTPDAATAVASPVGNMETAPQQFPQQVQAQVNYEAKLRAMRATPLAEMEREIGLIPSYRTYLAQKLSRDASKASAKNALRKRIAELIAMPEETFLEVEKTVKRVARLNRKGEGPTKSERFAQMKKDAGGVMLEAIGASHTIADELDLNPTNRVIKSLSFKVAGGINPDQMKQALTARDNRDGRNMKTGE